MLAAWRLSADAASLASPSIEQLRWPKPVRPGDTLAGGMEIVAAWPCQERSAGRLRYRIALDNQGGDEVLSLIGLGTLPRRPMARA